VKPSVSDQAAESVPSDTGRRSLLKTASAAAAATFWTPRAAEALVLPPPPSPPTTPWAQELPVPKPLVPLAGLTPTPVAWADSGECGRGNHPEFQRFPPKDFYSVDIKLGQHSFHPELPVQEVIGFNGLVPGPTFHARYGRPVLVRFRNQLPNLLQGFGSPDVSVHLHNMHTPSESDGFPFDWWSSNAYGPGLTRTGYYKDHHYPMVYAGLDQYGGIGDPREALGTLWYHDHRADFTSGNVYRGMAGFFLAFDEIDSGNEQDPNPKALRLPSGNYDVPLMVSDKAFDSGGYLRFDQFDQDGFIGDKFLVNGKIQPYFHVEPRKYRFRLLAAGTSRIFDFQLRWNGAVQALRQISSDGNLLLNPISRVNVQLGTAERADVVIDFSRYPVGTELILVNRLHQLDGRKPEKTFLVAPTPLLKFIVNKPLAGPDYSRVPLVLRQQPPINLSEVVQTRTFSFGRSDGAWTINERVFANNPRAKPKKGTAEIWNLRNDSGGWVHPVHIHFEEGRILTRNGLAPPQWERGRKDMYYLGPNENVSVFMRFRDFTGKYVMHCHNTMHEDHGMMVRYDIES
jgi:FtsP/CotA-like multicopper oxidase with cupredoxin domain